MTEKSPTFEASFEKLEKILEQLNTGKSGLEESLKLYEEASGLLKNCQERLTQAEQKIHILIKDRNGQLPQNPQMEDFSSP